MTRANRGFSLIELMAVVGVIGITAAVAAPSYTRLVRHRNLQATAQAFMTAVARGRAYSIANQQKTIVYLKDTKGIATFVPIGSEDTPGPSNVVVWRYPDAGDPALGSDIHFQQQGGPSGANWQINVGVDINGFVVDWDQPVMSKIFEISDTLSSETIRVQVDLSGATHIMTSTP